MTRPPELRLKARLNGRDEWGPERSVNLVVASAPWLSPWALLGYLFAVGAIITWAGLYGRRLWRERQRASQDLARSEELLKQSLWGSRGELWDADIVSGRVQRENRLPHLKLDRHGHGNHLCNEMSSVAYWYAEKPAAAAGCRAEASGR